MRKFLVAIAIATLVGGFGAFSRSGQSGAATAQARCSPRRRRSTSLSPYANIDAASIEPALFEFGDDDEEEGPEAPVGDTGT